MTAAMLDTELVSMTRKMRGVASTPLQRAVVAEAAKRHLPNHDI